MKRRSQMSAKELLIRQQYEEYRKKAGEKTVIEILVVKDEDTGRNRFLAECAYKEGHYGLS